MARSRRRFGPLFYLTAGLAVLAIASIPLWAPGIQQFGAWRLTRRLHDPAEPVRREAAEGLVQLGPAATWWVIRASRDPDVRVRILSCSILGRALTDGDQRPAEALLAAVRDGDASVRSHRRRSTGADLIAGPGVATEGAPRTRPSGRCAPPSRPVAAGPRGRPSGRSGISGPRRIRPSSTWIGPWTGPTKPCGRWLRAPCCVSIPRRRVLVSSMPWRRCWRTHRSVSNTGASSAC